MTVKKLVNTVKLCYPPHGNKGSMYEPGTLEMPRDAADLGIEKYFEAQDVPDQIKPSKEAGVKDVSSKKASAPRASKLNTNSRVRDRGV